jgi:hypothetical protein
MYVYIVDIINLLKKVEGFTVVNVIGKNDSFNSRITK